MLCSSIQRNAPSAGLDRVVESSEEPVVPGVQGGHGDRGDDRGPGNLFGEIDPTCRVAPSAREHHAGGQDREALFELPCRRHRGTQPGVRLDAVHRRFQVDVEQREPTSHVVQAEFEIRTLVGDRPIAGVVDLVVVGVVGVVDLVDQGRCSIAPARRGLRRAGIEGDHGQVERESWVVDLASGGKPNRISAEGRDVAAVDQIEGGADEEIMGGVGLSDRSEVAIGGRQVATVAPEQRCPAVELDALQRLSETELDLEQLPEQCVEPHGSGSTIDHGEEDAAAEQFPHDLDGVRSDELTAEARVEPLEHGE